MEPRGVTILLDESKWKDIMLALKQVCKKRYCPKNTLAGVRELHLEGCTPKDILNLRFIRCINLQGRELL